MAKHKDFLTHIHAEHRAIHKKVVSHPAFDSAKHNSLHGAMKLPDALSTENCMDVFSSIMDAADKYGDAHGKKLMFNSDPTDALDGILGGDTAPGDFDGGDDAQDPITGDDDTDALSRLLDDQPNTKQPA